MHLGGKKSHPTRISQMRRSKLALHPTNVAPELPVPSPALASASFRLWISAIHLLFRFPTVSKIERGPLSAAARQIFFDFFFPHLTDLIIMEGTLRSSHTPDFLIRQFPLRVVDPAAAFRLMDELCFSLVCFVRSSHGRCAEPDSVRPYRYVKIQSGSECPLEELFHLGGRDDVFGLVSGDFVLGEGSGLVRVFGGGRCCLRWG